MRIIILLLLCVPCGIPLEAQLLPEQQNQSTALSPFGLSAPPQFKAIRSKTRRLEKQKQIPGNLAILTDQDFLFLFPASKNEDRNYTQGTSFTYSHPNLMRFVLFYPHRKLLQWTGFQRYGSSLSLGGTAFTPRIIDSSKPVIGDRPFAFLLYLSAAASFKNAAPKLPVYHSLTLNIGLLGTNVGYAFQSYAHRQLVIGRPRDPIGWNTQISKGGSPTFLIDYNRFQPLTSTTFNRQLRKANPTGKTNFDLGWNAGASLGYYYRAYTSLFARLGWMRKDDQARWNGGWSSLTTASYQLINPDRPTRSRTWQGFLYTRLNATAMLRNTMLVGQGFKQEEYVLDGKDTKKLIYEWEWGFVIATETQRRRDKAARTMALVGRTVYRSPEFDTGIFPKRSHYYGSLGLLIPIITY